jgi:hypothetical protein
MCLRRSCSLDTRLRRQGVSRQDYQDREQRLRWAAIEAAQTAVRSNSEFHVYYQRIRMRKGTNAAKVATARRLLTIVYRILRQGRLYERRTTNARKIVTPAALVTD